MDDRLSQIASILHAYATAPPQIWELDSEDGEVVFGKIEGLDGALDEAERIIVQNAAPIIGLEIARAITHNIAEQLNDEDKAEFLEEVYRDR